MEQEVVVETKKKQNSDIQEKILTQLTEPKTQFNLVAETGFSKVSTYSNLQSLIKKGLVKKEKMEGKQKFLYSKV